MWDIAVDISCNVSSHLFERMKETNRISSDASLYFNKSDQLKRIYQVIAFIQSAVQQQILCNIYMLNLYHS